MPKTLYLWDLANTLFSEKWNVEKSGFPSFRDYLISLGYNPDKILPREYEWAHARPYQEGWFDLGPAPGFREVLAWTKHNETFSTGNREQMDWRAAQLNPKVGFDIRSYFQTFNSTFDYGDTNVKTKEMLVDYFLKKEQGGYRAVVYTDDNLSNGRLFAAAAEEVKKQCPDFVCRFYHFLNDNGGLRPQDGYSRIGSLYDLMEKEKAITEEDNS